MLCSHMLIAGAIAEVAKPSWAASTGSLKDMTLPGGDDLLGEAFDLIIHVRHPPLTLVDCNVGAGMIVL